MSGKNAKLLRRVTRRAKDAGAPVGEAVVKRMWLGVDPRLKGSIRKFDRKERTPK